MTRFPLLKLPYLCIEAVILNSEIPDLINFSSISKRTNRLVTSFKSPVSSIYLFLEEEKSIMFKPMDLELELKSTIELENLTKLFKCSVDYLQVDGDYLTEDLINFDLKELKKLVVTGKKEIENDKLKYLLGKFEVTETFRLSVPISNSFYCDPKLFENKLLALVDKKSAGWITREYLSQLGNTHWFDMDHPQFGIKDVVEFVTGWYNSKGKSNLKTFTIVFKEPFNPEDLILDALNPMKWDPERRPAVMINPINVECDFSNGLDILRDDGQLATILADEDYFIFHVWCEREMRGLPYKTIVY